MAVTATSPAPHVRKWTFTRPFTDTTDPGTANAASTNVATADTWTHLAGVYDANTGQMTLYVDGTANRTVTDSTPINASGPLVIGNGKFNGFRTGFFEGSVANVQVYPRALSAAEVATLHSGRSSDTVAPGGRPGSGDCLGLAPEFPGT